MLCNVDLDMLCSVDLSSQIYMEYKENTGHSLIIGREVLILTLYVLLTLQGCIS